MRAEFNERLLTAGIPVRAVLLHGSQRSMVDQRANRIAVAVLGGLSDIFRYAVLERDDPSLRLELASASLSGGRRVVQIRDCTDRSVAILTEAVEGRADVLAVATAGKLGGQSRLRTWAEQHPKVASISCEAETDAARQAVTQRQLTAAGLTLGAVSIDRLMQELPRDIGDATQDIERLALYVGPGEALTTTALEKVLGGATDVSAIAAIDCALVGDGAGAALILQTNLAGAGTGVGLTRFLGGDLLRLARAGCEVAAGATVGVALQRARVFGRDPRRPVFERAISHWPNVAVWDAIADTRRAEIACKQTGANEQLICSRLLESIARRGRGRGRA